MNPASRWERLGWAMPWLLFLAFPILDLITSPRPAPNRVVAGLALLVFVAAYLLVFLDGFAPRPERHLREFVVVAVLAVALAVWLGPGWSGLLIYVSAAAAVCLPERWVWPVVLAAAAVCAGVLAADT